jgi:hypothetical protein
MGTLRRDRFPTFNDFLTGTSDFSLIGTGPRPAQLSRQRLQVFVQDMIGSFPQLTINLGLRYELDCHTYGHGGPHSVASTQRSIARRMEVAKDVTRGADRQAALSMAGNSAATVTGLTGCSPRVEYGAYLNSIDSRHNFGPRFGVAWSRARVRTAWFCVVAMRIYICACRRSTISATIYFAPPFSTRPSPHCRLAKLRLTLSPYTILRQTQFPTCCRPQFPLSASIMDRNNRTAVLSGNSMPARNTNLGGTPLPQIAYVGTRGVASEFRHNWAIKSVPASPEHQPRAHCECGLQGKIITREYEMTMPILRATVPGPWRRVSSI